MASGTPEGRQPIRIIQILISSLRPLKRMIQMSAVCWHATAVAKLRINNPDFFCSKTAGKEQRQCKNLVWLSSSSPLCRSKKIMVRNSCLKCQHQVVIRLCAKNVRKQSWAHYILLSRMTPGQDDAVSKTTTHTKVPVIRHREIMMRLRTQKLLDELESTTPVSCLKRFCRNFADCNGRQQLSKERRAHCSSPVSKPLLFWADFRCWMHDCFFFFFAISPCPVFTMFTLPAKLGTSLIEWTQEFHGASREAVVPGVFSACSSRQHILSASGRPFLIYCLSS